MLPIVWRKRALNNLAKIIGFISAENPTAAKKIKNLIQESILPVAEHPYLYRSGRVSGTREIVVHPNYVLIYRVTAVSVEVVNILHARQEYPKDSP